ncbi:MAG TPA: hypothetical protein VGL56_03755 [Fimbriimonadaceae bacterium]|jgi:hypothetical protein
MKKVKPARGGQPPLFPESVVHRFTRWICQEELGVLQDAFESFVEDMEANTDLTREDLGRLIEKAVDQFYYYLFCDIATYEFDEIGYIADLFVEKHAESLSSGDIEYLNKLKKSVVSLYEVVEVVPKSHLIVKDLLLKGEPIKITEKVASTTLVQWTIVASRLIQVAGENIFEGNILEIESERASFFLEVFEESVKESAKNLPKALRKDPRSLRGLRRELIQSITQPILAIWISGIVDRSGERPDLENSDGEAFQLIDLKYRIFEDTAPIEKILDAHKEFDRVDDKLEWAWFGAKGKKDDTIRAFVHIEDGLHLEAEVNSVERADKLDKLISTILKGHVGIVSREDKDFPDEGPPPELANIGAKLDDHPEIRKAMEEQLTRHYRQTLSEKVPMLGDKTPEQLVKTAAGRKEVVEWLKFLENASAKAFGNDIASRYDFTWMWEELGIADLRK